VIHPTLANSSLAISDLESHRDRGIAAALPVEASGEVVDRGVPALFEVVLGDRLDP
jgi:hypothetical protein